MRFKLKTKVNGGYREVFKRFDRDLFEYLLPKRADVELVEFGGSQTGDRVHLAFKSPLKATWISEITEHGSNADMAWFVDVGTTLPFGLKSWRHRHIVRRLDQDHSEIIDDIEFAFSNQFLSMTFLPAVYLAFLPRKQQYRKYFNI